MKRKTLFGFVDVNVIMAVVVSLILLAVGVFAFYTLQDTLEENPNFDVSGSRCQTVVDPSAQQTVTIPSDATITRVYETLNTGSTNDIDTGNYTYAGTTVTINVTG